MSDEEKDINREYRCIIPLGYKDISGSNIESVHLFGATYKVTDGKLHITYISNKAWCSNKIQRYKSLSQSAIEFFLKNRIDYPGHGEEADTAVRVKIAKMHSRVGFCAKCVARLYSREEV